MAIVLDPILAESQDSLERQPIVELISTQLTPAIPFDGQYFNDSSNTESNSNLISCSTGQMLCIAIREVGLNTNIIFLYTDIQRTYWTEADTILSSLRYIGDLSFVELTDGNIGIIYIEKFVNTYYLKRIVIDLTGIVVSASSIIATYTSPTIIKDTFVILLEDNTYLLVYVLFGGIYYSIQKRTSNDFSSWTSESTVIIDHI